MQKKETTHEILTMANTVFQHLYFASEPRIEVNGKQVVEIQARVGRNVVAIFQPEDNYDAKLVEWIGNQEIQLCYTYDTYIDEIEGEVEENYEQEWHQLTNIHLLYDKMYSE
jgi:hypothetical protein